MNNLSYEITTKKNNVAAQHPEVINQLRASYNLWWESVKPLMVNEGLPKVQPKDQPLAKRYYEQFRAYGIPNWAPKNIDN